MRDLAGGDDAAGLGGEDRSRVAPIGLSERIAVLPAVGAQAPFVQDVQGCAEVTRQDERVDTGELQVAGPVDPEAMCCDGGETHRSVSKDIRGRLIVLPEPLPLLIADRAGRIPLSVDRTEEAERLLAVVDPAMRRPWGDEQRIQRFQGDDLVRHEGLAPTAQDNDAVDMRVLLQAGIAARRKLKIAKLEAGRHDRRSGEREPVDVAPPHPALIAERELVRLRLDTPPAKQSAIKGNLQTSQRSDERGRSLRMHGHCRPPLHWCIACWTSL